MRDGLPRREIREMIKDIPNPVLLDIGANDGNDTYLILKHCGDLPGMRIHSFEPDKRAIRRFHNLVKFDHRVKLHECAVGDKVGQVEFHVCYGKHPNFEFYGDWDKASSIRGPGPSFKEMFPQYHYKTELINQVTLDDWARDEGIKEVAFVWMDVEGHTDSVIRGGSGILKNTHFMFIETVDKVRYKDELVYDEIVELLKPNFEVVERFEEDTLFKNTRLR